ncbi:MAG: 3'(2'),5'-bisphosphate nucleotidase CysQ [Planctomycetaceae bacterium]|nr:3'(2'),5'-bisphosphate nucleotidase CysQ [Planctomycetaceae bacterium]
MEHCTEALGRIEKALGAAAEALKAFTAGAIEHTNKSGGDPVTEADMLLDRVLKEHLLQEGEGWLSEETRDDFSRLEKQRVWIVDPLDGTREFIAGIPEWCISIAYVIDGTPQAAGICSPSAGQVFLGAAGRGVTLNGKAVHVSARTELAGASVLASRSEVTRGQWKCFEGCGFEIVPMGSVAYKMARVAAGLADLTFTRIPKNEWDVAAGWLLVQEAGGIVVDRDHLPRLFNQRSTLLGGLAAGSRDLVKTLRGLKPFQNSLP